MISYFGSVFSFMAFPALLLLICSHNLHSQEFDLLKKIPNQGGPWSLAGDNLGHSVDIDGNWAVAGAPRADSANIDMGAVYVYYRDQQGSGEWGLVKRITAFDREEDDQFGEAVSLSGTTIAVGARNNDDDGLNSGSVYIYQKDHGGIDNWGLVKKLTASIIGPGYRLGTEVSLDGDRLAVVADLATISSPGYVYIYERNEGGADNWGEVTRLEPPDGAGPYEYGTAISLSGDIILVGSDDFDAGAQDAGKAYIHYKDEGGTDNWGEVAQLTASDGAAFDYFGIAAALDGNRAVVGAYFDNTGSVASGSAYIFEKDAGGMDNWGEVTKLTPSDGSNGDEFGFAVAVAGDCVAVGANGDDDNGNGSGSVYLYCKDEGGMNNWGEVIKRSASDGADLNRYGYSVALSGDTLLVGARLDSDKDGGAGSIYFHYRDWGGADNWGEVAQRYGSDGASFDYFGEDVALYGDMALIGSIFDNADKEDEGSARLFYRHQGGTDQWGQFKKLTAPDPEESDLFGLYLSLSQDHAIVGAVLDDELGENSGSAYIFGKDSGGADNWGQIKQLTASDGAASDFFGSVDISGPTAIAGASGQDNARGAAYIFQQNQGGADNWGELKKITASDGAQNDLFGYKTAISGDMALIGAFGDDTLKGSAYVFYRNEGGIDNWGQVAKLTAPDRSMLDYFGFSVTLNDSIAVVGAPLDDDAGDGSGSLYVFGKNSGGADNWGLIKKLTAADGSAGDHLGYSLSIQGQSIIAGAVGSDDQGNDSGAAYIFRKDLGGTDNWGQFKKLAPAGTAAADSFGIAVAVYEETALVGASHDNWLGTRYAGSAYVFGNQGCPDSTLVLYVDSSSTAVNPDGSSWADAFREVRDLYHQTGFCFSEIDSIFIAQGTYYPATGARDSSFVLDNRQVLVGGFPPGGGAPDPLMHPTILSGNIQSADTSDNSFHVVRILDQAVDVKLFGLQISGGNASGATLVDRRGGGLLVEGKLSMTDVRIRKNSSAVAAAGAHITSTGNLSLKNSALTQNYSPGGSFGMDVGGLLHIISGVLIE